MNIDIFFHVVAVFNFRSSLLGCSQISLESFAARRQHFGVGLTTSIIVRCGIAPTCHFDFHIPGSIVYIIRATLLTCAQIHALVQTKPKSTTAHDLDPFREREQQQRHENEKVYF
jgi:hypothetical protein